MLCLLSFLVFGFLGIFFSSYRELARKSLDCFTQRVKTGECDADFETRLKSTIIGKAMDKDRRLAAFLNSYMDYVTWSLVAVFLVAGLFVAVSVYNFLVYGSCSPASDAGCALSEASDTWVLGEIRESIRFWMPE